MNEEIWKPVVGYEGLYEVSNTGQVRSLDRYIKYSNGQIHLHKGKVLSPVIKDNGYLQVGLYYNGKYKMFLVHRVVAQAFIPNPDNLPEVNHLDEDKTNNNVTNLEWCDRSYNLKYGTVRIRSINTKIKKGYVNEENVGLSKEKYKKKYYQENKDKICDNMRIYYQENRDRICDNVRSYYQKNKDRICEQKKEYYLKRKEQIQNNVKSLNDQI